MTDLTPDMIAAWRANYGLATRTPEEAMRWWDERCLGKAPAGAVAALGLCLEAIARLTAERDEWRDADRAECAENQRLVQRINGCDATIVHYQSEFSRLDYALGAPNDNRCSLYDVDCDEARVVNAALARLAEAARTLEEIKDVLRHGGWVECDIAACNCGSWHHRYGLPERWREICDELIDADVLNNSTGNKPLRAVQLLRARLAEAERTAAQLAQRVADWEGAAQMGHPSPCTLGPLCPYCEIDRLTQRVGGT